MATRPCFPALGIALAAALAAWAAQPSSLPESPPAAAQAAPISSEGAIPTLRARLFALLVRDRARAIELAFGETFMPHVTELRIVLLDADEWTAAGLSGVTAYVPESHTLYFSRRLLYALTPPGTMSATQYWPWHEQPLRDIYPVVEVIDAALWTTLLQESAREHKLSWPHPQCGSLDIAERLPCEMLVQGVAAHTTRVKAPLFNENRMGEIWPEDLSQLGAWRNDDRAFQNIRKYGGYLLLRPLVREFGIARTLSYVAGTPFRIEDNNVRVSAERYQRRAQEALAW
jgi:hypothetical protein